MGWPSAIATLIAVVIGSALTLAIQFFLFYHNTRKERIFKMREALAEFGAAGHFYLDVMNNLAGLVQRSMRPPNPATTEEEKRWDRLTEDRERQAGIAYYASRDRLHSAKAKLYVLADNKAIQASVHRMWQQLIDVTPSTGPTQTTDRSHPHFVAIPALRTELETWLAKTASELASLSWFRPPEPPMPVKTS
ncbi:MAG: hypothetical protein AB7K52_07200 [Phycisphaerales bacterium]